MIKGAVVAALLMGSPAWAYETHRECIEAQILVYNNLAAIRSASSEFGREYRSQPIGLDVARQVDEQWKNLVATSEDLAKTHAEYCKTYPAD